MTMTLAAPPSPLRIEGKHTIDTAEDLCAALRAWIDTETLPTLDLSGVEACHASTLQLLCSASATARESGRTLTIASLSPATVTVIQSLGLQGEPLFALPAAA